MGTSGSFGGSAGADAKDLRANIAAWLDSPAADVAPAPTDGRPDRTPVMPGSSNGGAPGAGGSGPNLGPALGVLLRPRGASGGGGSRSGGGTRGGGGGRSSGGASRSIGRVSRAAGRAGSLALAYSSGNREALREAGLNYDDLQALGDPLAVGVRIVEVAFEAQADSTIADSEARDIVADVVAWILEQPAGQQPSPEEVVRRTIEVTIAETALTEVSSTAYAKGATYEKRRNLERQIRDAAAEYAQQANLNATGPTAREMSTAIENAVREIGTIYGVES